MAEEARIEMKALDAMARSLERMVRHGGSVSEVRMQWKRNFFTGRVCTDCDSALQP